MSKQVVHQILSFFLIAIIVLLFVHGCNKRPNSKPDKPEEQIGVQLLPRDKFPVFNYPEFVDIETAEQKGYVHDRDLVIGLVINDRSKAYPISTMGIHELGNDTLGGVPVAVSWCNICQSTIVYDRRVENRELSFGHTGRLYKGSFVLYDRQTNSQWVHVTGEAKTGPYKGAKLKFIPSTVTSWQKWKTLYPETRVLPGIGVTGSMGTFLGFVESDYFGLVVTRFNQAKLYPLELFKEQSVINDTFQGKPIVLIFEKNQGLATAWDRTIDENILTFRSVNDPQWGFVVVDNETKSRWDPITGRSIEGPYLGTELPALTYNPILIDQFKMHYPDGEIYAK